ncbi:tRNA (adenosine(37)-N6)-threonylcarbamoyltransferase complex dimerization subunit type 1 TsaB [Brevibacillus fluminis]|uniref:tRNA (Adenosine(37)-N6)-threonylcarbamoyltransferase complex dimerization subunit type 1 TsaB n=1 Tax=Brevibacillus fluminis TaxID=511487 RepID=A0A3M8DTJ3_9BACL|nr:tRNA (adenosine(37)-N6)-threonylcarbamoyltransferase complex dimerization subunit type 1 TsaB [Brevibacillus fluminis]RNB91503.1 tRNA (adenosine(37)-N6)-threonylcarbamoyltransferase complex dimerization subunit type 1 TsaB [Brevibacillus fluminis]
MRVLAIDTSNLVLSVAIVEEARVLGELTTNLNKNHSVTLMDSVSYLMGQLGIKPKDLSGIAVAKGPGSYTGVRIGVATAKSMAWSLGIPVIGISSLQTLACNAAGFEGGIVPLFDARRGQVYSGLFRTGQRASVEMELTERIILLKEWLPIVSQQVGEKPLLFLGDDTAMHRETIVEIVGSQAQFASAADNLPRASHIGMVALPLLADAGSPHELMPEYLQVAEAEAKWLAANKQ